MNIHYTTQFKKDFKRIKRQKKDLTKLELLIRILASNQPLDLLYKYHSLTGNWKGHRDCHIEPDWILIYRISANELYLERPGSHFALFKK